MPTLILLPGLASDETVWRDQLPPLRARGPVSNSDVDAFLTAHRFPLIEGATSTTLKGTELAAVAA